MCDVNTKEKTNGTRLRRLLLDGGTQVLRRLFDSIHPNSALPGVLKTNETLLRRKCRFDDQIELLFPSTGGQPDSKTFDITLLALLLSNICSLTKPATGWSDEPSPSDQTKEANIVRIRLFRNKIQHLPGSGIDDKKFEGLWNKLSAPLKALGLSRDEINNLKVNPIDDNSKIQERWQKLCEHEQRIDELEEKVHEQGAQIKEIKEELQDRKKQETIKSCIPDEPSSFIGRKDELSETIHAKTMADKKPFVLVYGMAGIGKSTLVKKASWDLVHTHEKIVYFVDLCRCKATEEDISKTIYYELYRGTKLENEPREALNIWAKNLDQNVILVLDNAEDVLSAQQTGSDGNSESGMSCFVKILLEIRKFSSQKVDYLIASREILSFDVDVSKKEINLKPFKENESLEFIDCHSTKYIDSSELTVDHKQEFVKLCSNIPLALHIVIPLLDDYSPDELIEKLRPESKDNILEPLKQALSLSFEKLDDTLRDHLLKLTIFSGSFAAESAMAIIGVDKKGDAVKVLKTLYAKSLLQRENKKYGFHPFIHKFVVDYGETEAKQQLLEEGKFNFLNHYQSLLLRNTKLYWTKDSCEQALSAFVEDRVHFEKALEILINETRMENTEKILKELTNVVMYLESCTSWDLLGRLLDKFIILAGDNNLPSRELESLCWKGHIARRRGDGEEYEKLVKQADELYNRRTVDEQSGVQIDDRAEVCYKSAKGRYLGGHKEDYEQGVKIFEEIKNFCEQRIDNNPSLNDYARAIVELGHNLKHKGEFNKAVENYKQASAIYEKHLGQHTKTALSFKDVADGYLRQDTPDHIKQALEYYNKAIDMLTKLRSDSETHMILLLKNTGVCLRKLHEYRKSEDHFMKALSIVENKLKENHKYKCWVKEELAYLYDDMEDRDKARSVAEEAIEMAKKMNLKAGDWIKNKERLQQILSYPQS